MHLSQLLTRFLILSTKNSWSQSWSQLCPFLFTSSLLLNLMPRKATFVEPIVPFEVERRLKEKARLSFPLPFRTFLHQRMLDFVINHVWVVKAVKSASLLVKISENRSWALRERYSTLLATFVFFDPCAKTLFGSSNYCVLFFHERENYWRKLSECKNWITEYCSL